MINDWKCAQIANNATTWHVSMSTYSAVKVGFIYMQNRRRWRENYMSSRQTLHPASCHRCGEQFTDKGVNLHGREAATVQRQFQVSCWLTSTRAWSGRWASAQRLRPWCIYSYRFSLSLFLVITLSLFFSFQSIIFLHRIGWFSVHFSICNLIISAFPIIILWEEWR